MTDSASGLSSVEMTQLLALLAKVQQPYTRDLAEALCGCMPVLAIEAIIMRGEGRKTEVLLLDRPDDDLHWRGQVCVPGSLLRTSDKMIEQVLERLARGEVLTPFASDKVIGYRLVTNSKGKRPSTFQLIHRVELASEPKSGKWYPVVALPQNLVATQADMIYAAAGITPNKNEDVREVVLPVTLLA